MVEVEMGEKGVIHGMFWRESPLDLPRVGCGVDDAQRGRGALPLRGPSDTHTPKEEIPICVSMLGMVWGVQMEGKGDSFLESRL